MQGFSFGQNFRKQAFKHNLPNNGCQNRLNPKTGLSGKLRRHQKHKQNARFVVRANFSETGFQAQSAKKGVSKSLKSENRPSISKIRKLAFQENFAKNQKRRQNARFFVLATFSANKLSSKICKKMLQNRLKSENRLSGKFRRRRNHKENEAFFIRAKFSETGRRGKLGGENRAFTTA